MDESNLKNDLKQRHSIGDKNQHHVHCIDHWKAHALRQESQDRNDDHRIFHTRDQSTGQHATGA
jgi:hypothetical protein